MSREIKYYVKGRFEGTFKTRQQIYLAAGEPFPEDDRHRIRIYRGIISEACEISKDKYQEAVFDNKFSEINHIQVNAGENWPVKNDRIFSLGEMKISEIDITGIQSINGHTYGNVRGQIYAAVTEGEYKEPDFVHSGKQEEGATNQEGSKRISDDGDSSTGSITAGDDGLLNRGCSNWKQPGCARWLIGLLLLALLIYLLAHFTEWGQQLICRYQKWRIEKETERVIKERTELQYRIDKTKPRPAQCGSQEKYEGSSMPKDFTYTLGTQSGTVKVQYDMFTVPDRLEVIYNGKQVAITQDTIRNEKYAEWGPRNFADSAGVLSFPYQYDPKELHELTIRVIPNPEVNTTKWEFKVICP